MKERMKDIVDATEAGNSSIGEWMLAREVSRSGRAEEAVRLQMKERLQVMKQAVEKGKANTCESESGLSSGDAFRMNTYVQQGTPLSGTLISDAMLFAMAVSESNARMEVIVATPTAESAGILPGVLLSLAHNHQVSEDALVMGLFSASAIGYVFANHAMISGAAGGCQAEIGSAAVMAAGTIVEIKGGSPAQASDATAIAMKSLLGLVCDPLAGLVEVPCVKRNVIGTSIAFSAADMALAGIQSRIPCDEVIDTMHRIGSSMPSALKETSKGGHAVTPAGQKASAAMAARPCSF
ncbi:L-serine ammonia-lyase, iron-sulfur-dependent, subunit alpha [Sinobaca qinghaiensis]|nr:L-serine ammonia-lyase, iron-sulfur-dependent, subunit alpha [Sinobaca qinghaiensis]